MPRIRLPRPFAAITFATVVACTSNPTSLCGCSLPSPHTILYGYVRGPAGEPVANAVVQVESGEAGCQFLQVGSQAPSGAAGRYRVHAFQQGDGAEMCVRLSATPPAGSSLRASEPVQLTLPMPTGFPADSVQRDLVLRAP